MPTERQRVAAVRTAQSKPTVERLHCVATRDERTASQWRSEKKDEGALEMKLRADPMRGIENKGEQWDGDSKETDEKHHP